MSNLKGEIRTYVRTVAHDRVFTMPQLLRHLGKRQGDSDAIRRVAAAVNAIRRDGTVDPETEIVLRTVEPGQAWVWQNYVPQPIDQAVIAANATPLPDESGPDPEEPEPPHVCAFEIVGYTPGEIAYPIMRNSRGEIFKAIPVI